MKEYDGKYVTLMLCSECNNNCKHCYISFKGKFTDNQLDDIIPSLMNKYTVLMNGTEPILNENYLKYYKITGNNSIMTNGISLINNDSLMIKLKENGINVIMLSYHYGIQDNISLISITQLDKLIEQLNKNGFIVKLMCSLSKDNYMLIEDCCNKAYNLGAKIVRFTNFINQGSAIENVNDDKFLNREQIDYVHNKITEMRKKFDEKDLYIERCGSFGPMKNCVDNKFKCLNAINMVVITPNKKVYGCIFDTSPGNEIGYLDDDKKIMIYQDVNKDKSHCNILKKYNNIDN